MVVSDLAMDPFLDQQMHVGKMITQIRNVNKIITTRALPRLFAVNCPHVVYLWLFGSVPRALDTAGNQRSKTWAVIEDRTHIRRQFSVTMLKDILTTKQNSDIR